jgi:hypothetical protein
VVATEPSLGGSLYTSRPVAVERAQLAQIFDLLAEDSWRRVYAGER